MSVSNSKSLNTYAVYHQAVGNAGYKSEEKKGSIKWFGIPVSLGITCLAALQLLRIWRQGRRTDEHVTWQVSFFIIKLDTSQIKNMYCPVVKEIGCGRLDKRSCRRV